MTNLTINNVDTGSVILEGASFNDNTFTAGSATTYKEGVILARNATTLKLVPFVKGGDVAVNGVPVAVLTYDLVATAAGDYAARPMVAGKVRQERLIIQADGDASNVDAIVRDQLRKSSIIPISVAELAALDNQ